MSRLVTSLHRYRLASSELSLQTRSYSLFSVVVEAPMAPKAVRKSPFLALLFFTSYRLTVPRLFSLSPLDLRQSCSDVRRLFDAVFSTKQQFSGELLMFTDCVTFSKFLEGKTPMKKPRE